MRGQQGWPRRGWHAGWEAETGDAGRCTLSAGQFRVVEGEGPSGRPVMGRGGCHGRLPCVGAQAGGAGATNLSRKGWRHALAWARQSYAGVG